MQQMQHIIQNLGVYHFNRLAETVKFSINIPILFQSASKWFINPQ